MRATVDTAWNVDLDSTNCVILSTFIEARLLETAPPWFNGASSGLTKGEGS
jgi:hypothetical protein